MKLNERIRFEKQYILSKNALVWSVIGAAIMLVTVIACGNLYIYSLLLLPVHAPPLFFFLLLYFFTVIAHTASAGILLCQKGQGEWGRTALIFLTLSFVFLFLWYVSFFKTLSFIFSLFLLLFALFLDICAIREIIVRRLPALVTLVFGIIFVIPILWVNISAIILN